MSFFGLVLTENSVEFRISLSFSDSPLTPLGDRAPLFVAGGGVGDDDVRIRGDVGLMVADSLLGVFTGVLEVWKTGKLSGLNEFLRALDSRAVVRMLGSLFGVESLGDLLDDTSFLGLTSFFSTSRFFSLLSFLGSALDFEVRSLRRGDINSLGLLIFVEKLILSLLRSNNGIFLRTESLTGDSE